MVGSDPITLRVSSQLCVYVEQSGHLRARAGLPSDFRFREFESGNFATSNDDTVAFVDNDDSTLTLGSWELVRAGKPAQREMLPDVSAKENVSAHQNHIHALCIY